MDRRVLDVARFEFLRFFDLKGEIISLSILALIALIRFGGDAMILLSASTGINIGVETANANLFPPSSSKRFNFIPTALGSREDSLKKVEIGELAGLLVEQEPAVYRLYTHSKVHWQDALTESFAPIHLKISSQREGVSEQQFNEIARPLQLVSHTVEGPVHAASANSYSISISAMILTVMGVISALAIIMQGIAGEKFGRISEIILAAISPAVWIDGKIIAAGLHGLKTMVSYAAYGVTAAVVLGIIDMSQVYATARGGSHLLMALASGALGLLLWSLIFSLASALLPNSTSPIRNTLILLPMTCLLLCLGGAKEPDNGFIVFLSFLPPTMPFAMPLRVISETASSWEIALSIILAIVSSIYLRHFVIKVFSDAVLRGEASGRNLCDVSNEKHPTGWRKALQTLGGVVRK